MRTAPILIAIVLLLANCRSTTTPSVTRLNEWLRAYNSGDPTLVRDFVTRSYSPQALEESTAEDRIRGFRFWLMNYGAMTPVRIDATSDGSVEVTVRQALTEGWGKLWVETEKTPPHRISAVWLSPFEPPPAGDLSGRLDDSAIAADLRRLAEKLAAREAFSGVVLVMRGERVIFRAAYGAADREAGTPNTPETQFELASTSKMFTAAAVARLASDGKLSFDDPIRIALPDYPNADAAGRVTIRHLLAHTSGLPDFYRNGKYRQFRSELRTLRDYWKTFAYDELEFDPGSRWSYSNSNYMLLGTIVESVSGRSFSDYVRDEVFARGGMQSSGYVSGGPRAARSYSRFTAGMGPSRRSDPERWHRVPVEPGSGGGPAGGGVSTAEDLGRFGAALLAGTIVPRPIVDEMMTAQTEMEGGGQAGLGLHIHDWSGTTIIGHGGASWGVSNQVDLYPDDGGYVVVVLSNTDTSGAQAIAHWARFLLSLR